MQARSTANGGKRKVSLKLSPRSVPTSTENSDSIQTRYQHLATSHSFRQRHSRILINCESLPSLPLTHKYDSAREVRQEQRVSEVSELDGDDSLIQELAEMLAVREPPGTDFIRSGKQRTTVPLVRKPERSDKDPPKLVRKGLVSPRTQLNLRVPVLPARAAGKKPREDWENELRRIATAHRGERW